MIHFVFAAEEGSASGFGALGVDPGAFIIQLISFVLVFLILMRFAFKPIVKMLQERRKVIEEGVKAGQELALEREKLQKEITQVMRDARIEADKIIDIGQKESREIVREAEKNAQRKVDAMIADAEARIAEEAVQGRRRLEKEIVGLVSEATEAIVEEKVDPAKDAELIDKALKGRKS